MTDFIALPIDLMTNPKHASFKPTVTSVVATEDAVTGKIFHVKFKGMFVATRFTYPI